MTTGEQVGAAVDDTIKATEQSAQDQIAEAKRSADAANAEAKRIADAALSSELGNQIATTRQENETWRNATEARLATMAEAQTKSEAALVEATTLFGSIRALLTPPAEQPKPLPPVGDTVPMAANSIKTEQSEKPKVAAEQMPAPAPRKRHFL